MSIQSLGAVDNPTKTTVPTFPLLTKNNLRRKVFNALNEVQQQNRIDRRALLGDFDYQMHPKPDSEAFSRMDRVPLGPQFRTVQFDAGVRRDD